MGSGRFGVVTEQCPETHEEIGKRVAHDVVDHAVVGLLVAMNKLVS